MTLEEKLDRLDALTEQMEGGVSLEKSLEIFEESVKLADECMKTLNNCKGKLEILSEKVKRITDEN